MKTYEGVDMKYEVLVFGCHHETAVPQVTAGGDGLQLWRVASNILNKQSRTADKRWPSSLGVERAAQNSSAYKTADYWMRDLRLSRR
jgi:hypothetical protein